MAKFQENIQISRKSRDVKTKLRFQQQKLDFNEKLTFREKIEISRKSVDFMKKFRFQAKIQISI